MGSIRARKDNGLLFFDFRIRGQRCREQTLLADNPANRKRMEKVLAKIESEIESGTFDYAATFPNGKLAFSQAGSNTTETVVSTFPVAAVTSSTTSGLTVTVDGAAPTGPLVASTDNFFYGTTSLGGANGRGVVFRIDQPLGWPTDRDGVLRLSASRGSA